MAQTHAPEKTILEYSKMGKAQDSFVQAVAREYAAFYDTSTAAKIVRLFTIKKLSTDPHTVGVALVDYNLRQKVGEPDWQKTSVNDTVAEVIVNEYGLPPASKH